MKLKILRISLWSLKMKSGLANPFWLVIEQNPLHLSSIYCHIYPPFTSTHHYCCSAFTHSQGKKMKLFSLVLFFLAFFLLRTSADDVTSVISSSLFDQMLKYRNDPRCKSNGFYTYNAFVDAAKSFNGFGTTGDITTRKREIAAFFGQTSHETTG